MIQLPKPPLAPRKTAKRPRIPPLLQGLHQPPPLPPKNQLFPPISERSGLGNGASDRFGLSSAIPTSNTEEVVKARISPEKRNEPAKIVEDQTDISTDTLIVPGEHRRSSENTPDPPPAVQNTDRTHPKAKTSRKRTKWSQKETEDLLMGVRRFGIGSWKQILECADFNFQRRTAVDLKDRFRICRPGEGLKARKGATTNVATTSNPTEAGSTTGNPAPMPTETASNKSGAPAQEASTEDNMTNDTAVAKPKDVYGPFPKSNRRARRHFSEEDDRNLLEGFERHGTIWRAIRDDFELGFSMRHPTDLRDRFRIRYPEEFAKAGFKLKPKEARELKEAEEAKAQKAQVSKPSSPTVNKANDQSTTRAITTLASAPASGSAPLPVTKPSNPTSLRPAFDPVTDFSLDNDEGERSPVILNRNILQWADENSTSLPTTTAAATNTQLPTLPPSDFPLHPFAVASDGLHINPLATLKLPSTAHWSYLTPSSSAGNSTSPSVVAPPPSLPPPAPLKHALPPNGTTSSIRAHEEMRTPNLPNIVFPYVPSASARNAVHNLPAPADILSERQLGAGDGFAGWIG